MPFCHSGLEPESRGLKLDSRFRGNDKVAVECLICFFKHQ